MDLNDINETHIWLFCPVFGIVPISLFTPFYTLSCSAWKQPSAQLSSLFAFAARINCGFISSSALCVRGLHVLIPLWSFRKVEVRIGFRFGLGRELDNTLCLKVKNQRYQYVCVCGAGGVSHFFFFWYLFFCKLKPGAEKKLTTPRSSTGAH